MLCQLHPGLFRHRLCAGQPPERRHGHHLYGECAEGRRLPGERVVQQWRQHNGGSTGGGSSVSRRDDDDDWEPLPNNNYRVTKKNDKPSQNTQIVVRDPADNSDNTSSNTGSDSGKHNPETGDTTTAFAAMALAAVSLGGVVLLGRRKIMTDHHLALQQIGLLEQLALRCGCLFVTQLRSVSPYRLRCALDSIDPDRYSLWEWNEAMRLLSLPELLR